MARTDPSVARHRGISFFLLDLSLPGIELRPLRQMTGEAQFDEVFLSDVRLPASALVGGLGEGWRVGMATLTDERGSVVAGAIGLERRLRAMTGLSGGAGGGDRVSRERAARLYVRGRALQALLARRGAGATSTASLAKLGMGELGFDAAVQAADLAGPDGLLEGDLARALTASPAGRIAGGTSQVQRTIIGERLLGLPKEPT
jgi:alkylation response protein AidB-like acyl-CoA dehydrogenase